jgi:hypothetical protein
VSPEKCNVLMVDRNTLVDRRIVLEAKLLSEKGCRVALVAAFGMLGKNESRIDGLPILRFNESDMVHYGSDPAFTFFEDAWKDPDPVDQASLALERGLDDQSQDSYEAAFSTARALFGKKLGLLIASLAAPRFAIRRLIAAKRIPGLIQKPAALVLALVSFNWGALGNWRSYARESHAENQVRWCLFMGDRIGSSTFWAGMLAYKQTPFARACGNTAGLGDP